MYNETIPQKRKDGTPFIKVLVEAGIIPGIKVDIGTKDLAGIPARRFTEGLDGLRQRLKWRAVIAIGRDIPNRGCIEANAQACPAMPRCARKPG